MAALVPQRELTTFYGCSLNFTTSHKNKSDISFQQFTHTHAHVYTIYARGNHRYLFASAPVHFMTNNRFCQILLRPCTRCSDNGHQHLGHKWIHAAMLRPTHAPVKQNRFENVLAITHLNCNPKSWRTNITTLPVACSEGLL